jgi:hypothetical protein
MYYIKRIRGLESATKFQKAAAEYIGIEFPLSYLRRSKIFGVFNHHHEIVGGFLIVMEGSLRSFESLPSLTYLPTQIDRWDVAEVNALWLAPDLRRSFMSILFWFFVITQLAMSGKKYFTYTYSTNKSKLSNFYARAKPIKIFEGQTKMLDGMTEEEYETIEVVSKLNVIIAPVRNIKMLFIRSIKSLRQLNLGRSEL